MSKGPIGRFMQHYGRLTEVQAARLKSHTHNSFQHPELSGTYSSNALVEFATTDEYTLHMVDAEETGGHQTLSCILTTEDAVYNFILDTWSPLSSPSHYLRPRYFLLRQRRF